MAAADLVARLTLDEDEFSGGLDNAADSADAASGEVEEGFIDIQAGALAASGAAVGVGTAFQGMLDDTLETRQELARVESRMDLAGGSATDLATDVSNATFPLEDAAGAMGALSRLGVETADDLARTATAADIVSDATNETATSVAENAVPALRAMGLEATDLEANMDTFTFLANEADLNVSEFGNTVERMAPELQEMGFELDETAALLASLTEQGLGGRTAIREFREGVREVEEQVASAEDRLVSLRDELADMRGEADAVGTDMTVLGERVDVFGDRASQNRDDVERLMTDLPSGLGDSLQAALTDFDDAQDSIVATEQELGALEQKMETSEEVTPAMAQRHAELEAKLGDEQARAREAEQSISGLTREAQRSDDVSASLADSLGESASAFVSNREEAADAEVSYAESQLAQEELGEEIEDTKSAIEEQEDEVENLTDNQRELAMDALGITSEEYDEIRDSMDDVDTEAQAAAVNEELSAWDELRHRIADAKTEYSGLLSPLSAVAPALQAAGGAGIAFSTINFSAVVPSLVAAATAAAPWILAIGAIVAIGWVLHDNWDEITAFVRDIWDTTVEGVAGGAEWLGDQLTKAKDLIVDNLDLVAAALFFPLIPLVVLKRVWESNLGDVQGKAQVAKEVVVGAFGSLKSGVGDVLDWVKSAPGEAFDALTDALPDPSTWLQRGKDLVQAIVDGILDSPDAVKDAVADLVGKARDLLPFSDAREGPLSDLTESGESLVVTLAEGVEASEGELEAALTPALELPDPDTGRSGAASTTRAAGDTGTSRRIVEKLDELITLLRRLKIEADGQTLAEVVEGHLDVEDRFEVNS